MRAGPRSLLPDTSRRQGGTGLDVSLEAGRLQHDWSAEENGGTIEAMTPTAGNRRVVVGVDASAASRQALRWAAREADLLDAAIDVVHAWTVPVVVYPEGEIFEAEPFHH